MRTQEELEDADARQQRSDEINAGVSVCSSASDGGFQHKETDDRIGEWYNHDWYGNVPYRGGENIPQDELEEECQNCGRKLIECNGNCIFDDLPNRGF